MRRSVQRHVALTAAVLWVLVLAGLWLASDETGLPAPVQIEVADPAVSPEQDIGTVGDGASVGVGDEVELVGESP